MGFRVNWPLIHVYNSHFCLCIGAFWRGALQQRSVPKAGLAQRKGRKQPALLSDNIVPITSGVYKNPPIGMRNFRP